MALVIDSKGSKKASAKTGKAMGAKAGNPSALHNILNSQPWAIPKTQGNTGSALPAVPSAQSVRNELERISSNIGASGGGASYGGGGSSYSPVAVQPEEPVAPARHSMPNISANSQNVQAPKAYAMPAVTAANLPGRIGGGNQLAPQMVSSNQPEGLSGSTGSSPLEPSVDVSIPSIAESIGIDTKHAAALDAWEQMAAERENRPLRTQNYWGEDYDTGGDILGWADNQLDYIGNTPTNDAYIRDAIANGASEEDMRNIMGRADQPWWQMLAGKYNDPHAYNTSDRNKVSTGDATVVDDGTSYDYDHMTSDTMTGTQYRHYIEMGMGGRPIEEIIPDETYNKRAEQVDYGFIPFTPDEMSYANMVAGNLAEVPNRAGKALSTARESILPDYRINVGGSNVSGKDFDKLSAPFMGWFDHDRLFNPEKFLRPLGDGKPYTTLVRQYQLKDSDGKTRYAYGDIIDSGYDDNVYVTFEDGQRIGFSQDDLEYEGDQAYIPDRYIAQHGNIVDSGYDNTFYVTFSDGQRIGLDNDFLQSITDDDGFINWNADPDNELMTFVQPDDAQGLVPQNLESLNDVDKILSDMQQYGGTVNDYASVIYLPDLQLSDGTTLQYGDVYDAYYDRDADDTSDGVSYEFSNFGPFTNKPTRLLNRDFVSAGDGGGIGFNFKDLADNALDFTLGSLPISLGRYAPWIYSVSGAKSSLQGVDPNMYNPATGSSRYIAGNYDDSGRMTYGVSDENGKRDDALSEETRYWNALGNAAVPLTEMIVGPVGEHLIPLERLFGGMPSNPSVRQVLKNELIGAMGEGIEEDLGNIFEDMTQYGWRGLFANPVLDENGNAVIDQNSHEVRDYSTPLYDRVKNALDPQDLANAFLGGVTVDAFMRGVPTLTDLNPRVEESSKSIPHQLVQAASRDRARGRTGVSQYVAPEPISLEDMKRVDDSYLQGFSDEIEPYYEER